MSDIMTTFEAIMDQLHVPVFLVDVDADGGFVYRGLNACHSATSGLENSALKGRNVYDVLPKRFADTVSANYAKCVDGRAAYRYEEVLSFEIGETWWLTTLSPVFEGEKVVGIIGFAENITEYKKKQFESLESAVEMKRLSEDISLFTALAAHDLRGPLRQIRLITELTEDGFVDYGDGKVEMLSMIRSVAARALTKVDEVLQHARAYTGEPDHHSQIDLGHLCADLIAILDPLSRFEVSYPQKLIKAEAVTLQVVLRNILENALKHASTKVSIDLEAVPSNSDLLEISVSDDGPGFADPKTAMITIVDQKSEEKSGFGLATVARLVASRGGELRIADPKFSPGATICWTLQAQQIEPQET